MGVNVSNEGLLTLSKSVELLPYKPRKFIEREFLTDAEIIAWAGKYPAFLDIELYPNYCLISFKINGKFVCLECGEGRSFNNKFLSWVMHNYKTVGFNSIQYDLLILWLSYFNQDTENLKAASNDIILRNVREYELKTAYNFFTYKTPHIDLIEVAPLKGSLKLYMARLHSRRIQELPFPDTKYLTEEEKEIVKQYNFNDLDGTQELFEFMKERLELRENMSLEYGEDLMSKSDAQIAEVVISKLVSQANGKAVQKPDIPEGTVFKYECPQFLNFATPVMQEFLHKVKSAKFIVGMNGRLIAPPEIDTKLKIGNNEYSFGIGGLHSTEKCIAYKSDEIYKLSDIDATSYYPNAIINLGLYPVAMGPNFLITFKGFKTSRVEAKRNKQFTKDKGLKIFLNGSSGKFSDPWSKMYSPNLTMQMNLTCQLSILMLVEILECNEFQVISANTDGITIYSKRDRQDELNYWIKFWENLTKFEMEETEYKSYNARDVNSYFAVKLDGVVKKKGPYAEVGSQSGTKLDMNPQNLICSDAIEALLSKGTPIEETITNCKNFTRFLTVRQVKGGAHKNREYLGKVIRWAYIKGEIGTINYVVNNNKVPDTDGAKPFMDLPEEFPEINYQWYIDRTKEILHDIGYLVKPKQIEFF